MTTTIYAFSGDETSSVTFSPTLDGEVYNAAIWWNMAGQRWYITVTSSDGTRVMTKPLISSTKGSDINLLFGTFTETLMVWREANGNIEVIR